MKIAFVTSGITCTGDSLTKEALGGSETALISVAAALAKRGHQVSVFCECERPGTYDGVNYYHRNIYPQQISRVPVDVLIASRWPTFLSVPSLAGLRVLWCHDILTDKENWLPSLWQTDLVMLLSDYHIQQYTNEIPEIAPHVWKTSNGVDLDLVNANIRPKVPGKLIFTSRPERGLDVLLRDVMPKLLAKKPNIRLHCCTYTLKGMQVPDYVKKVHEECAFLASKMPGKVMQMGTLKKGDLYQQISSSQLWVYPTSFPEIACIGAMEAQACGTPIVTTDAFALSETVGAPESKIAGLPSDPAYIDRFVERVLYLLDNPDERKRLAEFGKKYVVDQGYTWDAVAAKWEAKFQSMLEERWSANKGAVIKELIRLQDLVPAKLLAQKEHLQDWETEATQRIDAVKVREGEPETIVERAKKAMRVFDNLVQLLVSDGTIPATLLDYKADDISFGMRLKKALPQVKVTVLAKDADTAERLRLYAEKAESDVEIVTEVDGRQFDAVHLGNVLELTSDFQSLLARVQNSYLKDGGRFTFCSRYAKTCTKYGKDEATRLWNLDCDDWSAVLKGSGCSLAFVDERQDPAESAHGQWIGVSPKFTALGKIDLQGKARRTHPYKSLALAMITKNEEDWLSGSLKSVADVVDSIAITDSGSTDRTAEIAEKYGATVKTIAFDSFQQARNESLEGVKEDWILWIDADERVVNPELIRRYLGTAIFEGFVIRQNHLMLDVHGTFDTPVRLFKNRPQYKFVGMIHEHAEDTSNGAFDNDIQPALILDQVDIAHYGYLNESQRRQKCSSRNMELLCRDIEENGKNGRMLTWVLVVRDYLNIAKWGLGRKQQMEECSNEYSLVCAAIATCDHYFSDPKSKYYKLVEGMRQEALKILAAFGLVYPGCKTPPFELEFAMGGSLQGTDKDKHIRTDKRWFLNDEEMLAFVRSKSVDLVTKLGVAREDYSGEIDKPYSNQPAELPDAIKLLHLGVGLY